jgi:hypothetical protein
LYAPVSGVVEEVNAKLGEKPSLLNQPPEDEGASVKNAPDFIVNSWILTRVGFAKSKSQTWARYGVPISSHLAKVFELNCPDGSTYVGGSVQSVLQWLRACWVASQDVLLGSRAEDI